MTARMATAGPETDPVFAASPIGDVSEVVSDLTDFTYDSVAIDDTKRAKNADDSILRLALDPGRYIVRLRAQIAPTSQAVALGQLFMQAEDESGAALWNRAEDEEWVLSSTIPTNVPISFVVTDILDLAVATWLTLGFYCWGAWAGTFLPGGEAPGGIDIVYGWSGASFNPRITAARLK